MSPRTSQKSALSGLALVLSLAPTLVGPAEAGDALTRFLDRLGPYAPQVDEADLARACGADLHCAATRIAETFGGAARIEKTAHPSTDVIRWAETRPSLKSVTALPDGRRVIALTRFGRKAEHELTSALGPGGDLVLDLRENSGGDFGRMLRIAGLLIGPRAGALVLTHGGRREARDLPDVKAGARPSRISVLVGAETASSAEVLAALLRRHAGAEVLGTRTAGKDYLLRVFPVDQDLRLLVPAERIEVPGETLAGGVIPGRALPPALLATLAARAP